MTETPDPLSNAPVPSAHDPANRLHRHLGFIVSKLPIVLACVALAAAAGYLITSRQAKVYEARTTLTVGGTLRNVNPDLNQLLASQTLSQTYASLATKRSVLQSVINNLHLPYDVETLMGHVEASAQLDTSLLTIAAQDTDPGVAASIANDVAKQLLELSPTVLGQESDLQRSVQKDLETVDGLLTSTRDRIGVLTNAPSRTPAQEGELAQLQDRLIALVTAKSDLQTLVSNNASNTLAVVDPAVAPDPSSPVAPRPLINALLAAILGLLVASAIVLIPYYLDDSLKDPEDIRRVAGLQTLGFIQDSGMPRGWRRFGFRRAERGRPRLATHRQPRSPTAEAYRTARWNIEFAAGEASIRTLLVTSPSQAEGKTMVAANLAVAFAQAGKRVLLVDGDLRRPGVHTFFGLANARGLTTLATTEGTSVDAIAHPTAQRGLSVLTAGPVPTNPPELLASERTRKIFEQLRSAYDFIVVDSPPLEAVADAAVLSVLADGTVLVIDAGKSRRAAVQTSLAALARAGARVLGALLVSLPDRLYSKYADPQADAIGVDEPSDPPLRTTRQSPSGSTS